MMVQRANPIPQRDDYFPPKQANWPPNERSFHDPSLTDSRFNAVPVHPRSLSIEAALKDCVRIPVKTFALYAVLENGEERTYTSQTLTPYHQEIFSRRFKEEFRRNVRRAQTEISYPNSAYSQDGLYSEFEGENGADLRIRKQSSSGDSSSGSHPRHHIRQSRLEDSDDDDSTSVKRKRRRPSLYPQYSEQDDDTPVPVPVAKTQQLRIGDDAEVLKFYHVRFKDMQQSSCKVMGKAFVKLVEPKKQTHHPYTKGDVKAPPWWPPTVGENHVRHKEPDHLLKPERIRLLVWILRMIVEPYEKQHPTVQKLGLNVKKLEEVTMEAMSNWFNDKEHPENAAKKPFLKEIFKVARAEERYKNGEIDDTTIIPVMYGDRTGLEGSDEEPEEGIKDEYDEQDVVPVSTSIPTPESLVSPSMMQNIQSRPEESNGLFHRMRPLPVRYHTQPLDEQQQSYTDSFPRGIGIGFQQQSPDLPDRRSFASPGYQSPPQSMYGWQNNSIVNGSSGPVSSNNNFYVTTSPQSALAPPPAPYQLPLPNTQQNMLPPPLSNHHFDTLSPGGGRPYEGVPPLGNQLRTGSLGHPHHMPSHHGYQDFLNDHGGYGHGDEGIKDEHGHHIHSQ